MKNIEYSRLVDQNTATWKENPLRYRRQLSLFSYLGVVALAFIVLLSILFILSLKLFLALVGVIVLHSFAKAVFFKPEAVWGRVVTADVAAHLLKDVDEATVALGARRCDGVLVDFELNAAAVQFHKWGIVGPVRNYIVIGMPLMDSMARDHIRSTIAHEIAHLHLKHGSKARRWFAMLEMYQSLRKNLEGGYLWFLLKPFVLWYVPRLHAMLQPVSLQSEFEADAAEAKFTSPKIACEALCYLAVSVDRYRDAIHQFCVKASVEEKYDAVELSRSVHTALRNWKREEADESIGTAMLRVTDVEGSHPALSERLDALGGEATLVEPVLVSAAEEYFGGNREKVASAVAEEFLESDYWLNLASTLKDAARVEEQYRDLINSGEAGENEALDYIYLLGVAKGHDYVKPVIEAYSSKYAGSSGLQFYKGLALLRERDVDGIKALERAVELEPSRSAEVYEIIYQYLLTEGRAEDAAAFRSKRDEFSDEVRGLYENRLKLPKDVQYEPHDFSEGEILGIGSVLVQLKSIDRAYLAKRIDPNSPITMYDLSINMGKYRMTYDGNALTQEIEEAIAPLGKYIAVFYGPWLDKQIKDRIKATPNSHIYQRDAYLLKSQVESSSVSN